MLGHRVYAWLIWSQFGCLITDLDVTKVMCNLGLNKIEDFFKIMPPEIVKARIIEEKDIFVEIDRVAVFHFLL